LKSPAVFDEILKVDVLINAPIANSIAKPPDAGHEDI